MTITPERVPLLDARLELTRYLSRDELDELSGASLPVVDAGEDRPELGALLTRHKAFGATILDGLVMNSLRVGEQMGIQLLGPGDLLLPAGEVLPPWVAELDSRPAGPVKLGLLANDLLAATYRWPRLVQALYASIGDQMQRLTAQLVICQLPRVDDRVLAMLWLLAESWGQVTPSGVRLSLAVTHETLGALVGAARPTVTLALRKLTEEGATVHQDGGWLLLKAPAVATEPAPRILPPEIAAHITSPWAQPLAQPQDPSLAYAELRDHVRRLRETHLAECEMVREQLDRIRSTRIRVTASRRRIQESALRRRRTPSS